MDLNKDFLLLLNNDHYDKKDSLLILLLAHICTLHDPTPNTFIYSLYQLYVNGMIADLPNIQKIQQISQNLNHNMDNNLIINDVISEISNNNSNYHLNNFTFSLYNREFEEIQFLDNGGFGSIYLAKKKFDNKIYAIKKVSYKYKLLNDVNLDFLIQEVKNLAKCDHHNVNRYYNAWIEPTWLYDYMNNNNYIIESTNDNSSDDSLNNEITPYNHNNITYYLTLYIQLSYCNNNTLSQWLYNRSNIIDIDLNYIIISQIIRGLNHIHSNNIIHRDLKPSNIFINNDLEIKIGDFGLSKDIAHIIGSNISFSSGIGTSMYTSPEQLTWDIYTIKTDMYSLGLIILELFILYNTDMEKIKIFEKARQDPPNIPESINDLCPFIYELINNLLSHNPENRYDTNKLIEEYNFSNNYLYHRIIELKKINL